MNYIQYQLNKNYKVVQTLWDPLKDWSKGAKMFRRDASYVFFCFCGKYFYPRLPTFIWEPPKWVIEDG